MRRVELLRNALAARTGRAAVPLLAALGRRALLAAQTSGVLEAVAPHLAEPSPAVREQAARTLDALLQADYLTQSPLREGAASVLARSLQAADSNVAARVAALHALGAVGPTAGGNPAVTARLALAPAATFAEQGARLHALGELEIPGQGASVAALLEQLPLDAPPPLEWPVWTRPPVFRPWCVVRGAATPRGSPSSRSSTCWVRSRRATPRPRSSR